MGRKTKQEEISEERQRCLDIVQAARNGDIDEDFRSIIHMIESGTFMVELPDEEEETEHRENVLSDYHSDGD